MQNETLQTLLSSGLPDDEAWPVLNTIIVVVPLFMVLRCAHSIYFRFFTGGTKGKNALPIDEASESGMNVRVFLEIDVGDSTPPGRVELLLFMEHYPKTAESSALCALARRAKADWGRCCTTKVPTFTALFLALSAKVGTALAVSPSMASASKTSGPMATLNTHSRAFFPWLTQGATHRTRNSS